MRIDSTNHGDRIHEALDRYGKTGEVLPDDLDLSGLLVQVQSLVAPYAQVLEEVCLYDPDYFVAGTADKLLFHSKHPRSKVDILDFKTNLRRGIEFDNKYRSTYLPPFQHLTYCNYTSYALQLSSYAFMLEKMDRKIGKLGILYLSPPDTVQYWPVPYMKYEVEKLFEFWSVPEINWLND